MQVLSTSQRVPVFDDVVLVVAESVLELRCAWRGPTVKTWGKRWRMWCNTGASRSSKVLSMMARARSV